MKNPHDAYIAKAPEFAQPILTKLQTAVRKACPDVVETMKWKWPTWEHHGIMCGMAAFKAHVNMNFWRGQELSDPEGLFEESSNKTMVIMHFKKASDVPNQRTLIRYIKEAMKLNEATAAERKTRKPGTKKKAAPKKSVKAPADLLAALKKKKKALATFEDFSPSNKKDYVEWVTEAKRDETRQKRIAQAVEWMNEGKPRNWKYMKQWK